MLIVRQIQGWVSRKWTDFKNKVCGEIFFFSASECNTNPSAFDMCDREHESEKSENGCVCFSSAGGPEVPIGFQNAT